MNIRLSSTISGNLRDRPESKSRRSARRLLWVASWRRRPRRRGEGQWEQDFAWPLSSAVRKLEPQPQPVTAFGLFTVKPAPMSVST